MADINGIPYVESSDLVSAYPAVSQSLAQEVSDQLASKLPYSYGTATPSTTDSGYLWYDSNSTPAAPKFWDGAAFQALTSGKILQVVRATDTTNRSTTSLSFVDVTGLSVTITPSKSDSAVLLLATAYVNTASAFDNDNYLLSQITDSSNNPVSGAEATVAGIENFGGGGTRATYNNLVQLGYATPATTSPVTYKVRFRVDIVTTTASFSNAFQTAQLFAIEVSA